MKKFIWLLISFVLFTYCCKDDSTPYPENAGFDEITNMSFKNMAVNSIVIDQPGNKWVGTATGLYLYTNNKWYEYSSSKGKVINSITVHKNEVLVATSGGAYSLKSEIENISLLNKINNSDIKSDSASMFVYGYGLFDKKWIGSPDGLANYDSSKWKRNENIFDNLGGILNVKSMAFRVNDCFFGTYGNYLYHFTYDNDTIPDAISGASYMMGSIENPEASFNGELTTDTIFCVFAGSDTSIWYGSTAGLTRNKGNTKSDKGLFEYFLRGQRVRSVIETSDKKIYAGTENGLHIKNGSEWTNYSTKNGLPGNIVLSIAQDKDLSIWLGTDKGISHIVNGSFINF